jgi:transposase, IS5 family
VEIKKPQNWQKGTILRQTIFALQMYEKELFCEHSSYLHARFLLTDVGQLHEGIPFDELVKLVPVPKQTISGKGCKPWFDIKGGIGLQFLKHYLRVSDAQLIERVNTDWSLQYFCGIQLGRNEIIADKNLPGFWRNYIGRYLDIDKWQKELARTWKPYMKETTISSQDATCYESYVEYPTHVKTVWKGCNELHLLIQQMRKKAGLRKSRNNYDKWKKRYLSYQKKRKKPRRQEKKLRKELLKYLRRLIELTDGIMNKYPALISLGKQARVNTIRQIYVQQHDYAYGRTERIEKQIVSIDKPYIRPIVRGKEVKAVEFGAKVNKLQVNGINFIEHLNYEAFHEGNRMQKGIWLHEELMGECTHHSADAIYATNANRTYCRKKGITTNFIPKGKEKAAYIEQNKVMRTVLNKERGTRLEGSFGNEKNHFLLNKVKARTKHTETCWIFFGIHTANAKQIADRMMEQKRKANSLPAEQLRLAA